MDKQEFITQVRESELTMYRAAKSILINENDCADAVQEAIYKAYEKLHTLKDERYFRTWLVKILIRECYRIRKHNKKFVSYEDYMTEDHKEAGADYGELYGALMELNENLRTVTVLYYIDGFSTMEIAKILGVPKGTVNSRMARARLKLKEILEEERVGAAWIN